MPEMTQEEQKSLAHLHAKIKTYNEAVPGFRIGLPHFDIPLDLKLCVKYYFQYQRVRLEEDGLDNIVELLTLLQEKHPLEFRYCGWKNDAIANLMLESLDSKGKKAATRWLRLYRRHERAISREAAVYLSPKRTAASRAAFELELMKTIDENPKFWKLPSLRACVLCVNWLNKNWNKVAAKKRSTKLLPAIASEFRRQRPLSTLSDRNIIETCMAYRDLASNRAYTRAAVQPYPVMLALVARRHHVSPRLVSAVRAGENKLRIPSNKPKNART